MLYVHSMPSSSPPKRIRWELILLAATVLLLLASETVLQKWLTKGMLLVVWTLCFVFTGAAFVLAWIEMRRVRQQWRDFQREAFRGAFENQPAIASFDSKVASRIGAPAAPSRPGALDLTQQPAGTPSKTTKTNPPPTPAPANLPPQPNLPDRSTERH